MAVAIPVLSLVSGIGAASTAIAAGASIGLGTFLSIAGGLASTIGMLDKNSDLQKLGGILALGGAATNFLSGAGNAAGASTGTATATGDALDTAQAMTAGAEGGETLLTAPGASSARPMPSLLEQAKLSAGGEAGMSSMTGIDAAGNVVSPMGGGMGNVNSVANTLTGGGGTLAGGAAAAQPMPAMSDFLAQQAAGMTGSEVAGAMKNAQTTAGSLWDRATGAMGKAGEWVQKNPMAATFAMQGISGTMASKAQQDALDYQKSLMERARQNMNSPVRMQFTPGG